MTWRQLSETGCRIMCLLSLLTLHGCSLQLREANSFLEHQQYVAAEQAFKNILAKDSTNPRALEGLHRSREGVLDKRLLEVRFLRLAGNHDEALETLGKVIDDENAWKLYPRGPVFFTQREEVRAALMHASNIIYADLKKNHPVPARRFYERHMDIFGQGDTLKRYGEIREDIYSQGKKTCEDFRKGAAQSQVYYGQFLNRYCGYWDKELLSNLTGGISDFNSRLYGSVTVKWGSETLPAEITNGLSEIIQNGLQRTPFYDPKGRRKLEVRATAEFKDLRKKAQVDLTQEYTTQEPYTAYVPVMKSRQVPYQTTEAVMKQREVPYTVTEYEYNYYTRQSSPVQKTYYRTKYYTEYESVTKYKTEYYTETEATTRYKTVPHAYNYVGTEYRQNLILLINAKSSVNGNPIVIAVNRQDSAHGVAHNENIPAIGLTPRGVDLIEPVEWIRGKSTELESSLESKLQQLWADTYCRSKKEGSLGAADGEAVHRCLRSSRGGEFGFVDQWYKTYVGIPYSDAKQIFRD